MNLNACKYGLALLLLATGAACEKPITVEVPAHERQIVTQALASPDSVWRVIVSSSVGFQDNVAPFPLTDATVEVREGGELVAWLQHTEHGVYKTSLAKPVSGSTYSLHVSAPGYEAVTSSITIPEMAVSPRVTVDGAIDSDGSPFLNVAVDITDQPQVRNYYAMDVVIVENRMVDGEERQVQSPYFFETSDVVLLGFSALDEVETYNIRYFQDDLFDGESETINIRVLDPEFVFFEEGVDYAVVLRFYVTDESYFRFFKTAELQQETEDNPFGEPVRVFSNMSNGFGIFAGYQVYATVLAGS